MFESRKRIFANKRKAPYAQPMCPYLTNDRGYSSMKRSSGKQLDFTPAYHWDDLDAYTVLPRQPRKRA